MTLVLSAGCGRICFKLLACVLHVTHVRFDVMEVPSPFVLMLVVMLATGFCLEKNVVTNVVHSEDVVCRAGLLGEEIVLIMRFRKCIITGKLCL